MQDLRYGGEPFFFFFFFFLVLCFVMRMVFCLLEIFYSMFLYFSIFRRLATDLNLHQPSNVKPTSEAQEREMLNRTRTWMICYNQDRSTATQYGKPSTIKEDL